MSAQIRATSGSQQQHPTASAYVKALGLKTEKETGEVERDRWLTQEEADRLIAACAPHLAALVRFALATGCRAVEIIGLEWDRVDVARQTAWLNRTKNGTPRGVPLNGNAIAMLEGECGKTPMYCFTYRGEPIGWDVTNTAWQTALRKA